MANPTIPKAQGLDTCLHDEFWLCASDLLLRTLSRVAFALIGIGLRADIWSNRSFCLRGKRPTCIDFISSRNVFGVIDFCYVGSPICRAICQIPFIPRRDRETQKAPSESSTAVARACQPLGEDFLAMNCIVTLFRSGNDVFGLIYRF
jgi:hypothetical protein